MPVSPAKRCATSYLEPDNSNLSFAAGAERCTIREAGGFDMLR